MKVALLVDERVDKSVVLKVVRLVDLTVGLLVYLKAVL